MASSNKQKCFSPSIPIKEDLLIKIIAHARYRIDIIRIYLLFFMFPL